jgi:hypothetical protein
MHIDTAHKAFELAIGGSNAREWTNRTIHAASSFQGPHGERPRAPKDLPRHATAAVLCLAQAALCGSMFPACVGGARRSVLLRAARPGETIPANNATERPVVDGMRPRNVGSRRGREKDSNPRSPMKATTFGRFPRSTFPTFRRGRHPRSSIGARGSFVPAAAAGRSMRW